MNDSYFKRTSRPTVISLFTHSWWLFSSKPAFFTLLAFAAFLPTQLSNAIFALTLRSSPDLAGIFLWLNMTLSFALLQLAMAALVYSAYAALRGRTDSLNTALTAVFNRLGTLIVISIILGICGPLIQMALMRTVFSVIAPSQDLYLFLNTILRSLIKAFTVAVIPICIIEGRGAIDSVTAGIQLTASHVLTIFILVVIVGQLAGGVNNLIESYLPGRINNSLLSLHIIAFPVSAFFVAFEYVMYTVIYMDLR